MKLCACLMSLGLFAQHGGEEHHNGSDHNQEVEHAKHKLALYGGFTHVDAAFVEHETGASATGKWVPTLGLDYFYSFSKHWALGVISDLELLCRRT